MRQEYNTTEEDFVDVRNPWKQEILVHHGKYGDMYWLTDESGSHWVQYFNQVYKKGWGDTKEETIEIYGIRDRELKAFNAAWDDGNIKAAYWFMDGREDIEYERWSLESIEN